MQGPEDWWPDDVAGMMQRARKDVEDMECLPSGETTPPVETDLRELVRSLAQDFAAKSKSAGGWLLLYDSSIGRGQEASTPDGTLPDVFVFDVTDLLAAVRIALGPTTDELQIRVMVLWSEANGTYQFQYCAVSMHHEYAEELMQVGDSESSVWAGHAAEHGIDVHTIEGSLYD